jgi:hypothetical protein
MLSHVHQVRRNISTFLLDFLPLIALIAYDKGRTV